MTTVTTKHTAHCPTPGKPVRVPLLQMFQIARQRRKLARLDTAALRDIGLTKPEAITEANRPFWDV